MIEAITPPIRIIVEKYDDAFVAHISGIEGVVVAEGNTYEEAVSEARSALAFHMQTFSERVNG